MSYSNTHYEAYINTYSHVPRMYIHAKTVFFISTNSPLLLLILSYSYKTQHFFQFINSPFSPIKVTFEILYSIRRACFLKINECLWFLVTLPNKRNVIPNISLVNSAAKHNITPLRNDRNGWF